MSTGWTYRVHNVRAFSRPEMENAESRRQKRSFGKERWSDTTERIRERRLAMGCQDVSSLIFEASARWQGLLTGRNGKLRAQKQQEASLLQSPCNCVQRTTFLRATAEVANKGSMAKEVASSEICNPTLWFMQVSSETRHVLAQVWLRRKFDVARRMVDVSPRRPTGGFLMERAAKPRDSICQAAIQGHCLHECMRMAEFVFGSRVKKCFLCKRRDFIRRLWFVQPQRIALRYMVALALRQQRAFIDAEHGAFRSVDFG
ncbi:uncharacterized protein BDZ99DRAFT_523846 [Mytilinidion resinicola]|uniref:Uncharacterized protein n=1 Tax=Mytilinidion resinicola TaxID=574789 RepID=A0A6A6YE90_9PEZI|nr:uncharacterized protein BDZ99DRAFT_523846 [Mytilinidion resinicola]KAF2806395.1 hypothetical protein BDZ99DRAFT_523846 [Mytilinidion resinicola]